MGRLEMNDETMVLDLYESARFSTLDKWEQDFIVSINEQIADGSELSVRQHEKVEYIYGKYFG